MLVHRRVVGARLTLSLAAFLCMPAPGCDYR